MWMAIALFELSLDLSFEKDIPRAICTEEASSRQPPDGHSAARNGTSNAP
jgi:hypothetical protein